MGSGLRPSFESQCPIKPQSFSFALFNFKFCFRVRCSKSCKSWSWSCWYSKSLLSLPYTKISSAITSTLQNCMHPALKFFWSRRNAKWNTNVVIIPKGVQNVVNRDLASWSFIWWKPSFASNTVNNFAFANVSNIPSRVGIRYFGLWIGPMDLHMHTCILPCFTIVTMLLINAVGSCAGVMIPCLVNWSNLCFKQSVIATGNRWGTCCTGCMVLSTLMWYSSPIQPNPSNTSWHCSINL